MFGKKRKISFFYIGVKEEDRKIVSDLATEQGMTIADFVSFVLEKEISKKRKEKERGK